MNFGFILKVMKDFSVAAELFLWVSYVPWLDPLWREFGGSLNMLTSHPWQSVK